MNKILVSFFLKFTFSFKPDFREYTQIIYYIGFGVPVPTTNDAFMKMKFQNGNSSL